MKNLYADEAKEIELRQYITIPVEKVVKRKKLSRREQFAYNLRCKMFHIQEKLLFISGKKSKVIDPRIAFENNPMAA
jgi:hypothetical protein